MTNRNRIGELAMPAVARIGCESLVRCSLKVHAGGAVGKEGLHP